MAKQTRTKDAKEPKKSKKPPAAKSRARSKKAAAPKGSPSTNGVDAETLATMREELEAARAELARLASGEHDARRALEERQGSQQAVVDNLRSELEATRLDLKAALADLEIAKHDKKRLESRNENYERIVAEARESERRVERVSDGVRDQLLALKTELERVRAEHATAASENDVLRRQLALRAKEPLPS